MRIKSKTMTDRMNAEKPDAVLADLEAKHSCAPAPCSAAWLLEWQPNKSTTWYETELMTKPEILEHAERLMQAGAEVITITRHEGMPPNDKTMNEANITDSPQDTARGSSSANGSPARYVIGHVSDLEKVPADRLEACLRELRDFVETARSTRELVTALATLTGASSEMRVGDFTWIDDGKNKKTVTFSALENDQSQ